MSDFDLDRERRAQERARTEKLLINLVKLAIVILGILLGAFVGYATAEFLGAGDNQSLIIFTFGMFFGGMTMSILVGWSRDK